MPIHAEYKPLVDDLLGCFDKELHWTVDQEGNLFIGLDGNPRLLHGFDLDLEGIPGINTDGITLVAPAIGAIRTTVPTKSTRIT